MSRSGGASFEYAMTLDQYKKEKVRVLKDLGIKLTGGQKSRLYACKSEIQVDNFAHSLIVGDCD